jgi:hypothetical protein
VYMIRRPPPSPYIDALFLLGIRCAGKYFPENIRRGHLVWANGYVKWQESGSSICGVSCQCIGQVHTKFSHEREYQM